MTDFPSDEQPMPLLERRVLPPTPFDPIPQEPVWFGTSIPVAEPLETLVFFEDKRTGSVVFTEVMFLPPGEHEVVDWLLRRHPRWRIDFDIVVAPRLTRLQRWWNRVRR